jgi:hypothetical protein
MTVTVRDVLLEMVPVLTVPTPSTTSGDRNADPAPVICGRVSAEFTGTLMTVETPVAVSVTGLTVLAQATTSSASTVDTEAVKPDTISVAETLTAEMSVLEPAAVAAVPVAVAVVAAVTCLVTCADAVLVAVVNAAAAADTDDPVGAVRLAVLV